MRRALPAACLVLCAAAAAAQDAPRPPRIEPPAGAEYGFVIERRTEVRRDPGHTFDEPRTRRVVSAVRVRPRAVEGRGNAVLDVTFIRVRGFETGADVTQDVTFDRRLDDPPTGRAETQAVGRTVELEVQRDGTFVAVRGADEAIPGSTVAATALIADVRALVAQLPPAGDEPWETDALEGRALLRTRVTAKHSVRRLTEAEARIEVEGTLAAAPEGAGEEFAKQFRVSVGERSARYRVSLVDGLPIEGRVTTAYAVEARLSGSDMQVGVDTSTVVTVRRTASPDDPAAEPYVDPSAPAPGGDTPNVGLPGWIGTPRKVLHEIAGAPTHSGDGLAGGAFDTFGKLGLVYEYDDDGYARRITATKASGEERFSGKILGLALGDPLARVEELWDASVDPVRTGKHEFDTFQIVFETLLIELEVWREDGEDPAFGTFRAKTIKRIRVTKR